MTNKPLSDNEAHDRLSAARAMLDGATGETVRGNTALEAARRSLDLLAYALLVSQERAALDEDQFPAV